MVVTNIRRLINIKVKLAAKDLRRMKNQNYRLATIKIEAVTHLQKMKGVENDLDDTGIAVIRIAIHPANIGIDTTLGQKGEARGPLEKRVAAEENIVSIEIGTLPADLIVILRRNVLQGRKIKRGGGIEVEVIFPLFPIVAPPRRISGWVFFMDESP